MNLDNPFEAVVHHLIIGGMTGLDHRDGVPMMSTLMCMVTYWTGPTVSHDVRLLDSYDFTKLLYCIVSQP